MMPDPNGGSPVPTPEEIAEYCRQKRESWTEEEEAAHRSWQVRINKDGTPGIMHVVAPYEGIQW